MGVKLMTCTIEDDRTPDQRRTHTWAVVMRDRFMSGWGGASGGASRCAWAIPPDGDVNKLARWVRSRGDAQYVTVVTLATYRPPRGTVHFQIYVVGPCHPSGAVVAV
jgi:hypothetical protein